MNQSTTVPPIRLEFVYTGDDIRRALRLLRKNQVIIRRVSLLVLIASCAILFVVSWLPTGSAAVAATAPVSGGMRDLLVSFGPYAVIFAVLWVVFYVLIRGRWAKLVPPGVQKVQISEEGIVWDMPGKHAQIQWNFYRFFSEDAHLFLLGMTAVRADILPKRVMTAAQIDAIRMLLRSHILGKTHAFPVMPAQAREGQAEA